MEIDRQIASAAFHLSLRLLDELKAAPVPLPVGLAARFQSFVPIRTPDEILAMERDAYWFGYAETMREFIGVLAETPRATGKKKSAVLS